LFKIDFSLKTPFFFNNEIGTIMYNDDANTITLMIKNNSTSADVFISFLLTRDQYFIWFLNYMVNLRSGWLLERRTNYLQFHIDKKYNFIDEMQFYAIFPTFYSI